MSDWIESKCLPLPASLGIAAFGPLCLDETSKQYGHITSTPKLAWQNTPILQHFARRHQFDKGSRKKNIFFDTDCNVCAKYIYQKLAGKQVNESLCYVTVGTGIGIGLVASGKCVHGMMHPEAGHCKVPRVASDAKFKGACPFHGDCVEGLCSNGAIQKRLGLKSVHEIPSLPDKHGIWDVLAEYLGTFCANIMLVTSSEKIVLGGGIFNRKCLLEKTRKVFAKQVNQYVRHEKLDKLEEYLVRLTEGDELGMLAAAYVGATH